MKTRSFLLILLSLATNFVFADAPGKKQMYDSKVSFQNIKNFQKYNFYWQGEYDDSVKHISSDTSMIIPSSGGRPLRARFWAINTSTKQSTDTLSFENYYAPDFVVILDSIGAKLGYHKTELSNKNQITDNAGSDEVENKELVNDAKKANINHLIKMIVWGTISAIAFILLVWLFIRRRHKKP